MTLTQRYSDGAIATVAMDSSQGSKKSYFPQALRGNTQNTTRILIWNPGVSSVNATVRFLTHTGQEEERRTATLAGKATKEIILGGQDAPVTVGWVEVMADGLVLSTAFYSVEVNGVAVPPVAVLPVKGFAWWSGAATVSGLVDTGFAAANTGPTTVDCGLDAYTGTSGRLVGSGLIRLPPGGQLARFLSQLIPGLPVPYQGSFLLRCQRGSVVPVTLTQRASDGAIATVAMSVGYLCQVSNRALLCVSSFNRSPEFSLLSVIEFVEEQFLISLVEILA